MKRNLENIAASIQARLKNKADEEGRSFNEILHYYGMERFLHRLSKTSHGDDFILKGGLMFYGLGIPLRRATRDIDFLGATEYARADMLAVFQTALAVSYPEDGIRFDAQTLRLSQTQVEENRGGIRITFVGYLDKARIPIQVDIGFSDELASAALRMDYPVLLADMEKPRIKGYPPESIISEKLYALVRFAEINSRWKDYYDIYLLASTYEFESRILANAIHSTFHNRTAKLATQIPYGLRDGFASANQKNWEAFLDKSKLHNPALKDLKALVNEIWQFLEYPINTLLSGEQGEKRWSRDNGWQ